MRLNRRAPNGTLGGVRGRGELPLLLDCVWLVAYDHFQLYHVDQDLFFTLGTIQWEFYQNRIVIHFGSSFAATDRAANPP